MSTSPPSLDSYPRPGVTVDLAVLTVTDAATDPVLRVLIQDRDAPAGRALPGGFVRERKTVAQTTADVLSRKLGIDPGPSVRPRLLRLFDEPERDDRSWVMSAAHALCLPEAALRGAKGDLVPITADGSLAGGGAAEKAGDVTLLFDHDEIVQLAVAELRRRYEFRDRFVDVHPDPDGFLAEPFTLHQLRKVHEAVVGDPMHKDNFSRRMKEGLRPVMRGGEPVAAAGLRGRPATLYQRSHGSVAG